MKRRVFIITCIFICMALSGQTVPAQTTEFTYQGSLDSGGAPANGNFDFELALFDSAVGGSQVGALNTRINVAVSNGSFTLSLDFGDQFPGADRFLEIRVRPAGGGAYTPLAPRQKIASAPYAVQSVKATNAVNATTATNALSLGGVAANQYVLTADARLWDARSPLPGSSSYIQNGTAPQGSSNFNISGTGTAGVFSAGLQFNIGPEKVFSIGGTGNTFVGRNVAALNTGNGNSFFGSSSGSSNTSGGNNSFFGTSAGASNTVSSNNAYFGNFAGKLATGGSNAFFGSSAGDITSTGSDNTFIGFYTGSTNITGSYNTALGSTAMMSADNLTYATAIGAGAVVGFSNTVVLGRPSDTVRVPGNLNVAGTFTGSFSVPATNITGILGAGNGGTGLSSAGTSGNFLRSTGSGWTSAALSGVDIPTNLNSYIQNQNSAPQPMANFRISGTGTANLFDTDTYFSIRNTPAVSIPIDSNTFIGFDAGADPGGSSNSYFGWRSGRTTSTGTNNVFAGALAGEYNMTGSFNSFFGESSGWNNNSGSHNSFFGQYSGVNNVIGNENSFFGASAGQYSTGSYNSFFGASAGAANTTGVLNTFIGQNSGLNSSTGEANTAIGYNSGFSSDGFNYATAIGADAFATSSNSITLGRGNGADIVRIPGSLTVTGTLSADGSGLTDLNASNFTTGILAPANGGTGIGGVGALGSFLRSDGTNWFSAPLSGSDIPPGSVEYIWNQSNVVQSGGFAIDGTARAGVLEAAIQLSIDGYRVLSIPGSGNLFAGPGAGWWNPGGADNAFFGWNAGSQSIYGSGNAIFGSQAGLSGDGSLNAFFGFQAGYSNSASQNAFFGGQAGFSNTYGHHGAFFGEKAGYFNTTGLGNAFFGSQAGYFNSTGDANAFFGTGAGFSNTTGDSNAFFGNGAGYENTTGFINAFFGKGAGASNTTGSLNTIIGPDADVGAENLTNATALGYLAMVGQSNSLVLGSISGVNGSVVDTFVGIGTPAPAQKLHVVGNSRFDGDVTTGGNVTTGGKIKVQTLGAAGLLAVCLNPLNEISTCASSARYKSEVTGLRSGLDLIRRLRPVSFTWNDGGMPDFGLVAEEVAAVEPLLTTTNSKGEVEGVKYDRIGVVLINAVREQQAEIERLKKENARLKSRADSQDVRIDLLVKLVCSIRPDSEVCIDGR